MLTGRHLQGLEIICDRVRPWRIKKWRAMREASSIINIKGMRPKGRGIGMNGLMQSPSPKHDRRKVQVVMQPIKSLKLRSEGPWEKQAVLLTSKGTRPKGRGIRTNGPTQSPSPKHDRCKVQVVTQPMKSTTDAKSKSWCNEWKV